MDLLVLSAKKKTERQTILTEKKNILLLPRWYPNKSDIQLGTFIQAQAILLKDIFNIYVIYVQGDPNLKSKYEFIESTDLGIHERIVYFKQSTGIFKKITNGRRYKMAQLLAFKNWDIKVDLCHVHVPYRSAFLALDLQRKGIPFVITEHWSGHLNGEYLQKNAADRTIYKQVLSKATNIATVSHILKAKFKENTGFDSVVIPNFIEQGPYFDQTPRADTITILSISDFINSTKNITGLLTAFSIAIKENPTLNLTLIGGGPDETLIANAVRDLQLMNHVTLVGRLAHEDVLKAYSQCDFYVCNSNFETFGMTVAEALLAGKPVVCTLCGGPEEFLNSSNSITVPLDSPSQLSSALLKMAKEFNSFEKEKIAQAIRAQFGTEAVKTQLKNFYNSAIQ
jgi:glycosyltransferase involved in cell wall biosynthesis